MKIAQAWKLLPAAVMLAGAGLAAEWSKTYTTGAAPEVRVDTNDASVTIHSGAQNRVQARVRTSGWNLGPQGVQIRDRQTGGRVEFDVRVPSGFFIIGNHGVNIEIEAPPESRLSVHTGDGRIRVSGIRGSTQLSSGDGSIEADAMGGAIEARSGDGHIRLQGRIEALSLRTGDGRIEVEAERGSRIGSGWRLETGDGSVTLRLPPDFAAELDARTGDGRISVDFPVTVSGSADRRNQLRGPINGGGASLYIRSKDGSIRIRR